MLNICQCQRALYKTTAVLAIKKYKGKTIHYSIMTLQFHYYNFFCKVCFETLSHEQYGSISGLFCISDGSNPENGSEIWICTQKFICSFELYVNNQILLGLQSSIGNLTRSSFHEVSSNSIFWLGY